MEDIRNEARKSPIRYDGLYKPQFQMPLVQFGYKMHEEKNVFVSADDEHV